MTTEAKPVLTPSYHGYYYATGVPLAEHLRWGQRRRVYFLQRGQTLVVLLAGGDESTQDRDIATALALAREL